MNKYWNVFSLYTNTPEQTQQSIRATESLITYADLLVNEPTNIQDKFKKFHDYAKRYKELGSHDTTSREAQYRYLDYRIFGLHSITTSDLWNELGKRLIGVECRR
ncbi:MAG: hypothetical protein ACTSXD_08460 [Candidatus Heimdallarchaeaceae archaeon]